MGEKHCPKQPTATSTTYLSVAVDLGWASRNVIEGMIAEHVFGVTVVTPY